jgi:N-acetylmuramic acid 6-phosphate etherase
MPSKHTSETRLTEQRNPKTTKIDELTALELVDLINSEDAGWCRP